MAKYLVSSVYLHLKSSKEDPGWLEINSLRIITTKLSHDKEKREVEARIGF